MGLAKRTKGREVECTESCHRPVTVTMRRSLRGGVSTSKLGNLRMLASNLLVARVLKPGPGWTWLARFRSFTQKCPRQTLTCPIFLPGQLSGLCISSAVKLFKKFCSIMHLNIKRFDLS